MRSEGLRKARPFGSSALLPEDGLREFLPEPIRLVRIGRLLEPTRESKEALPFRLSCLEASLDEVHEDSVGAQLSRLRNRAYSLRNDRG